MNQDVTEVDLIWQNTFVLIFKLSSNLHKVKGIYRRIHGAKQKSVLRWSSHHNLWQMLHLLPAPTTGVPPNGPKCPKIACSWCHCWACASEPCGRDRLTLIAVVVANFSSLRHCNSIPRLNLLNFSLNTILFWDIILLPFTISLVSLLKSQKICFTQDIAQGSSFIFFDLFFKYLQTGWRRMGHWFLVSRSKERLCHDSFPN